ncbi:MAG: prolipoprotein diacylglyceryl transferase [Deltaproteobacteria bacterium]|nr:prolipoprotein diacylglyceryl transferase [Deltaproteobacteria bacterium]
MIPVLFKIPLPFLNQPFEVRAYGVLIALGFLLILPLAIRQARKEGISSNTIIDVGFWGLLMGLIGARVLYIVTEWEAYKADLVSIFYLWEGGLVFYGGLLAGCATLIFYAKKKHIPLGKLLDVGAPAVAFVHFFGRLGCLAAGCCFGKPTQLPWGIFFKNPEAFARPLNTPLHPTQIYEMGGLLFLFVFLYFVLSKYKKFDGQLALSYLILYSVFRFVVEFFRGDDIRGFVIPNLISTSQFVSLVIFLVTVPVFIYFYKKAKIKR